MKDETLKTITKKTLLRKNKLEKLIESGSSKTKIDNANRLLNESLAKFKKFRKENEC